MSSFQVSAAVLEVGEKLSKMFEESNVDLTNLKNVTGKDRA